MFTSLMVAAVVMAVGMCYPAKLPNNANIEGPTIPPKYNFEYNVNNPAEATAFRHEESRDNNLTEGEYEVQLPDGRVQTVTYTADENGFVANVKYEGEVVVQGPPPPPPAPAAAAGPQPSLSSFSAPVTNSNAPLLPLQNEFNPRAPQQEEFFPTNQQGPFFPAQDFNQFQENSPQFSDQFFNPQQPQPQQIQRSDTIELPSPPQPQSFSPQSQSFSPQPQSFSPASQSSFQPILPSVSRLQARPSFG